jgi:3' exoribonuclease, RNase T-like
MNYWFDTEFVDDPHSQSNKLISIGIVSEDGREFYAIDKGFRITPKIRLLPVFPWLEKHVFQRLADPRFPQGKMPRLSRLEIKEGLMNFIGKDNLPTFWANNGAYDWFNLCKLFGGVINMPIDKIWRFFDLKQLACQLKIRHSEFPLKDEKNEHNALIDARWDKQVWDFLNQVARRRHIPVPQ